MSLFEITVQKSLGGRNDRSKWLNTYHIFANKELQDSVLREDLQQIVDAEKLIHTSAVQFMSARIKQRKDTYLGTIDPGFVTKELSGQGARTPPNTATMLMPLENAVEIKRGVEYLRSGRLFLRGCLYTSDGVAGIGGGYSLDAAGDFATGPAAAFIAALNADLPSGGYFVIPNIRYGIIENSRNVTEHELGGIVNLSRNRNRKSVEQAEKSLEIRKAYKLAKQAKALLNGGTVSALTGAGLALWNVLRAEAAVLAPALPAEFIGLIPEGSELALLLLV